MPAPASITYATRALIAASNSLLTLLDEGTGAGSIKLYTEVDVLLATIVLDDPAGTVSAAGVLTLDISGPDTSADAYGRCTYCTICDSDDEVFITIPVVAGDTAVSGFFVLSNTYIVGGEPVEVLSAVIGG